MYKCKCGESNPEKFYGHKKQVCGKCHNEYTKTQQREKRRKAIQYLGGKCSKCGYSRCIAALDIHHLDSSVKDINFKSMRGWSWNRIENELQTCILLCSNCHAEEHYLLALA